MNLPNIEGGVALANLVATLPGEGVAPAVNFLLDDSHTTFTAEYGLRGADLVFHFYLPQELLTPNARGVAVASAEAASYASQALENPQVFHYWAHRFGEVLDVTAREYFRADSPRLAAAYTREVSSWWLQARNFDHLLNVPEFAREYMRVLDEALDAHVPSLVLR